MSRPTLVIPFNLFLVVLVCCSFGVSGAFDSPRQVGQEKAMFNHLISFFAGTASDDENADVGEISAKAGSCDHMQAEHCC